MLKDFLEFQGRTDLFGSKTVVREAFNTGLIMNGNLWIDAIEIRNKTSHIYDENEILKILEVVFRDYQPLFINFEIKMKTLL